MFKNRSLQVKMIKDENTTTTPEEEAFVEKVAYISGAAINVTNAVATNVMKGFTLYMALDTARKIAIAAATK